MTTLILSALAIILVIYLRPLWLYLFSIKKIVIKRINSDGSHTVKVIQLPKDDPLWKLYYEQKAGIKIDAWW